MATSYRHHPPPWIVDGLFVRDRNGAAVATVTSAGNAERIAACVTACEGIPTGELQAGIIQDLVASCERTASGRLRAILDRMQGK
jgi:hypothetical protein